MEYHKRPEADLSLKHQLLSEIGLAFALLIFVLTFIISKEFEVVVKERDAVQDEIDVEQIEQTVQQKTIPKPKKPSITVREDDEDVAEDEEFEFAEDDSFDIPAPPPPPKFDVNEEIVDFFAIEQQPELIGGNKALYKAVKYPEMAQRAGVEGIALIEFIVGVDGVPRDFIVKGEKPPELGFGEAAIAALQKVTFKPGKQRDRFVAVRMQQSIRFTFSN
jgi:periplasmic protein TonB